MSGFLSLHFGEAGIRSGTSCWKLLCLEHLIRRDGVRSKINHRNGTADPGVPESFFYENEGRYFPRALFIDHETNAIDELKTDHYRHFFNNPNHSICQKSDTGGSYARGYFTNGKVLAESTMEGVRKLANNCDSLGGVFIHHSVSGGTGSGLTTLILERIYQEYDFTRKCSFGLSIFPSRSKTLSALEPYNTMFSLKSIIEYIDVDIMYGNDAIGDICSKKLEIDNPNFGNINEVIAHSVNNLTNDYRLSTSSGSEMIYIHSDLVPYKDIKFCIPSFSSISTRYRDHFRQPTAKEITNNLFQQNSFLIDCNPETGKYFSCYLQYRGDLVPKDVSGSFANAKTKKEVQFVDWSPTGCRVRLCHHPMVAFPNGIIEKMDRCVGLFANNTSFIDIIKEYVSIYDILAKKKSFFHWYLREGMEEKDFVIAREKVQGLIDIITEASAESVESCEEGEFDDSDGENSC